MCKRTIILFLFLVSASRGTHAEVDVATYAWGSAGVENFNLSLPQINTYSEYVEHQHQLLGPHPAHGRFDVVLHEWSYRGTIGTNIYGDFQWFFEQDYYNDCDLDPVVGPATSLQVKRLGCVNLH